MDHDKMGDTEGNNPPEEDDKLVRTDSDSEGRKHAGNGLIIAGYVFAALGGLVGIIIGAVVAFGKEREPSTGEIIGPRYDPWSVRQGKIVFYLALGMTIFWNLLRAGLVR